MDHRQRDTDDQENKRVEKEGRKIDNMQMKMQLQLRSPEIQMFSYLQIYGHKGYHCDADIFIGILIHLPSFI